VDHARFLALSKASEELKLHAEDLQEALTLKDRKCLKLEVMLAMGHPMESAESGSPSPADPISKAGPVASEFSTMQLSALTAELEAIKMMSQRRLEELKHLYAEKEHYKVQYEALHYRHSRMPRLANYDANFIDKIESQYKALKEEIEHRIAAAAELSRHVGDTNSRRSQKIEALEAELTNRRLAAKDFAEAQEADVNRMRKDRDHMRELYEAANMQAASLNKQNAHLLVLTEQLSSRLSLNDTKLREIIEECNETGKAEAMILAEIESIGEAFDNVQKQNAELIKLAAEKDQVLGKITSEV